MIPIGWLRAVRGFAAALTVFSAAGAPVNYDEAKVPPYSPPDPLRMEDGRVVTNAAQWREARRPELLGLFRREVYGKPLGRPAAMRFVVDHEDPDAMGGRAIRRDVRMLVGPEPGVAVMKFAVVLPKASSGPAPVFVGVSLFDLAKPYPQPAVALASSGGAAPSPEEHVRAGRATADRILGAGFGFASVDIGLLAPDSATNYWAGAAKAMGRNHGGPPGPEETGALGIWAWGLSRVLDYLETLPEVDSTRVAVIGHSRMGKTALWAAANDERFAMAISNDSGCGGAALSKRIFGETVAIITHAFPHWFCGNFLQYADREERLPVDQHQLLALIAPRPLYVASAADDGWADPKGEFLSALYAEPVYKLFNAGGLGVDGQPPVDRAVGDTIGYHVRHGRHDLTEADWIEYLRFAERHFGVAHR
jgi:dienelactone hydrolase